MTFGWVPTFNTASIPHQHCCPVQNDSRCPSIPANPVLLFKPSSLGFKLEFPFAFSVAWAGLKSLRIKNEGAGWAVYTRKWSRKPHFFKWEMSHLSLLICLNSSDGKCLNTGSGLSFSPYVALESHSDIQFPVSKIWTYQILSPEVPST